MSTDKNARFRWAIVLVPESDAGESPLEIDDLQKILGENALAGIDIRSVSRQDHGIVAAIRMVAAAGATTQWCKIGAAGNEPIHAETDAQGNLVLVCDHRPPHKWNYVSGELLED